MKSLFRAKEPSQTDYIALAAFAAFYLLAIAFIFLGH